LNRIEQHDQPNFFPTATLPTRDRNIQIVWKDESEAAATTATTILNWNLPPAWVPPEEDLFPKSGKALSIHNDYFVMLARDCFVLGNDLFAFDPQGMDLNDHDSVFVGKRVGQNVENLWTTNRYRAAVNCFGSSRRVILTDRWIFM
jgi:hypothetical protein